MPRSVWKPPHVNVKLAKKIAETKNKSDLHVIVNTRARNSMIIPEYIGATVAVYNGKEYVPFVVTEHMTGRKLGEFAPTRTFRGHAGAKQTKRD